MSQQDIGLSLDAQGWARIDELVERAGAHGVSLTRDLVLDVAERSDKQHFQLRRHRPYQGQSWPHGSHRSGHRASEPPAILFHGTAVTSIASIMSAGLIPGLRRYVHLSVDTATASSVGRRRGRPVVLRVAAGRMWAAGFKFVRSASAVWLTSAVPVEFIQFPF